MSIVIKAERIHSVNGDAWKLLECEMLGTKGLPSEYLSGCPKVYKEGEWIFTRTTERDEHAYSVGAALTPAEFDSLLETCRLAGERLSEIHRRIWSPSWKGGETFKI